MVSSRTRSERDTNLHNLGTLGDKTGQHSRIHSDFPCWSARCLETPRKRDARLKNEISMNFGNKFSPPLKSACAALCFKNMCCASRFCTGGRGAAGSRSKQMPKGPWSKMLARGTVWGSETKVEAGAGAAPRTRKPGQSARAESTQGVWVFPWSNEGRRV